MRKFITIIILLLIPKLSLSQELNIKSIIKNQNTIFDFKEGKLKTIKTPNQFDTYLEYNENGYVSEIYELNKGIKDSRKVYEYDKSGFVTKYSFYRGNKLIKEETFSYEFENTNFIITSTIKNFQLKKGTKFHLIKKYKMVDNTLTFTSDFRMEKNKNKNKTIYTFENDNLVKAHFAVDNKDYFYIMNYTYDKNIGVNSILMKKIFGEKYFINNLLIKFPPTIRVLSIISKNNLLSKKLISKGKIISVDKSENIEIKYNKENLPTSISKKINNKIRTELIIGYE